MAKGSQLSQLKSALHQAGVTGQQQSGKKRKRSHAQEKDKSNKAAKLAEIHERLNPFDTKVTKLKHDLAGRKIKGIAGKPAQSKQAGIEQRKKTLLKEYEDKHHSGGIIDRRFGEDNPHMSIEERMLERFTRERQRGSRGNAFNLEDEDELTHYGTSLSKLDDFDDVGLPMDDEDEEDERGQIDQDVVRKAHFSGFDDEDDDSEPKEERKKSKAEVMAEVIAKSKEHKFRRQMEREQNDNVRHELDEAFESMRELLFASAPLPESLAAGNDLHQELPNKEPQATDDVLLGVSSSKESGDAYDQRVRELAFDKRAKPKDRLKTEEEIALEMKEALEKAERKRQKRMLGEDDNGSGEETRGHQKRKRGGDDLEDDFYDEGWQGFGTGLGDDQSDNNDSPVDEESNSSGEEDEESDSEESGSESSSQGSSHEELYSSTPRPAPSNPPGELPFTFPCPVSLDEFLETIDGISDSDIPTVIHRIRTLHHASFSPGNKAKLQGFLAVLVDYVFYAAANSPRPPIFNAVIPHILQMSRTDPIPSAVHFNAKLSIMHDNLKRTLRAGTEARPWPGLSELFFLRLIPEVWSTSDLNHAVVSPARVLIGTYLGLGRIRSLPDIASGAFLTTIFLQFEVLSQRFVPESLNFLVNATLHLAPHNFTPDTLPGSFTSPDLGACVGLRISGKAALGVVPSKPNLTSILSGDPINVQAKVNLLSLVIILLGRYADMYKSLDSFVETWEPIDKVLGGVITRHLNDSLKSQLSSLREKLARLLKFSLQARRPLLLQAHKPIPIPTYIPKFETSSSSYLRRQDPDHERNQASKLRHQYKQERKGAIRELRKDARFLAGVEQQKQREKDEVYASRMKKAFSSIESERAEQKAMERERVKERRRSGRK